MANEKYYYNTTTLRYEKIEMSWKQRLLKIFGFFCAALVSALVLGFILFQYLIDTPEEKLLKRENTSMVLTVAQLQKQSEMNKKVLESLQKRDDNLYRVIFEAEPLGKSIRDVGVGGSNKYKAMENLSNGELLAETASEIDRIKRQLYIQSKSYDQITELVENQEEYNASRPAIQPISNVDLTRMASGYGMRIHPIYKTRKMHYGMDFTAPTGTDVYATGKGVVAKVTKGKRGYGQSVIIDHGFGFKTRYAHLSRIDVKKGDKVMRGDVIGLVGSTGLSTAPHLHYEVIKLDAKGKEQRVNPVYYYYNDLSPEEYERMIELSAQANQSFD